MLRWHQARENLLHPAPLAVRFEGVRAELRIDVRLAVLDSPACASPRGVGHGHGDFAEVAATTDE